MDGVLADFESRFQEYAGVSSQDFINEHGMQEFWKVTDANLNFWSSMRPMPGAEKLWRYLKDKNVTLLTTPSPTEVSRIGKKIWKAKFLQGRPGIIFSHAKYEYANPKAILIDDYKKNLKDWALAGGIPVRCAYGKVDEAIATLDEILSRG